MTEDAEPHNETNPLTSDEQESLEVEQALDALDAGDEGIPLNDAIEHVRRHRPRT